MSGPPISDHELENRFGYHPATPATGPVHDRVRNEFLMLARWLVDTIPAGRHQSLALTSLQESMMWSNAAVACDTPAMPE